MLAVERTALVLLAAGRSSRFGAENKLHQDLLGRPMGLHIAATLADLPFPARIAVVDANPPAYPSHGFRIVRNDDPAGGMARSLALGIACAEAAGVDAALIALADMPCVTAAHILRLFDMSAGETTVIASTDGRASKPPALFGRAHFAALRSLTGDAGARDLIRTGQHVPAPPAELIDIDTRADLDHLRSSALGLTRSGQ